MKNKKGVSAIIATILIVMLTFVVAGILFGFAIPWVQDTLEGERVCLEVRDYVEVRSACYNETGNYTKVMVRRDSENISIDDIEIIVRKDDKEETFSLEDHSEIPIPGQSITYELENIAGRSIPDVMVIIGRTSCNLKGYPSVPKCT